ncbi:MAG: methylated-DNA--[protein]-cysteine S-methyltransferase, partial [Alphaproteobacteria bacterium]
GAVAVHLRGTNFQIKVWEALLRIPAGTAVAYGDVATAIGRPGAARAVAAAVAANPVAYLVPCHRVIRSTGPFHGYAWGAERKRAILAWESARHDGQGFADRHEERTNREIAVPLD